MVVGWSEKTRFDPSSGPNLADFLFEKIVDNLLIRRSRAYKSTISSILSLFHEANNSYVSSSCSSFVKTIRVPK